MPNPIHVLELRSVRGTGGGPEKTILLGAARSDPARVRVTVCYIRDQRDRSFGPEKRAAEAAVDYVEIRERHSFDPSIWPALRRLVHERDIDIVHAHDYKTNVLAMLLARSAKVIPLSTAHGWTGQSLRERFLYYQVDKRLLATLPCVIAVSGSIRHELIRAGASPGRVHTVLNGIDPWSFRRDRTRRARVRLAMGIEPDEVVIGAVGRLEPQKRFDLLLDAVAMLRRQQPALAIAVAGDGSLRLRLQAQAGRLGFGAGCRFLGHSDDVVGLHHAFDVFVQSSEYEGTPNAVLEAMALETPVVATRAGGTHEVIEDGVHGLLVPPGKPEALADAINHTLINPVETAARVAAARGRIERELSFAARMEAVDRIYEELMKTPASGSGCQEKLRWA